MLLERQRTPALPDLVEEGVGRWSLSEEIEHGADEVEVRPRTLIRSPAVADSPGDRSMRAGRA